MGITRTLKKLRREIDDALELFSRERCATALNLGEYASIRAIKACPYCGSQTIRVVRTAKPHRYYKCTACGEKWRSTEYFRVRRSDYRSTFGRKK